MTTTRNTITADVTLADIVAACKECEYGPQVDLVGHQLNPRAVWTHRHETGMDDNDGLIPADALADRYVFAAYMSSDVRLWITTTTNVYSADRKGMVTIDLAAADTWPEGFDVDALRTEAGAADDQDLLAILDTLGL